MDLLLLSGVVLIIILGLLSVRLTMNSKYPSWMDFLLFIFNGIWYFLKIDFFDFHTTLISELSSFILYFYPGFISWALLFKCAIPWDFAHEPFLELRLSTSDGIHSHGFTYQPSAADSLNLRFNWNLFRFHTYILNLLFNIATVCSKFFSNSTCLNLIFSVP